MSTSIRVGWYFFCIGLIVECASAAPPKGSDVRDPGPRPIASQAPGQLCGVDRTPFDPIPIDGLTADEMKLFCAGLDEFKKVDTVKDDGLGPTMNFNSCVGCHQYPQFGGSSPLGTNPQFSFAKAYPPGTNVVPTFITEKGPVREARFKKNRDGTPDGGVHSLFTITGLPGSDGCVLKQPDFKAELKRMNVIFRIPTPTFGLGLVEEIEDQTILDSQQAKKTRRYGDGYAVPLGRLNIVRVGHAQGTENRNGNDGTIARFGWKAQNKSLLVFSGEAYNVEMGISNELFQTEREEKPECQFHTVPNDTTSPDKLASGNPFDAYSDIIKFAAFMRFLAPPVASTDTPGGADSIERGRRHFEQVGCGHCHTPELHTSKHAAVVALRDKTVKLYSDLAIHRMGTKLADGISQGQAKGDEFRSAPLWGLGQRVFFLHDGRTDDLVSAIVQHAGPGSEANRVIKSYTKMKASEKQDLLNFLRSL